MRTITRTIILLINLLFLLVSCLIIISVNYYNEKIWFISLIGFANSTLLIIHLFFGVFWLFCRHKYYSIISTICIIAGIYAGGSPFEINGKEDKVGMTLVSYNVRNFDLYNWRGNFKRRDSIIKYLTEIKPDIICFQEYYNDKVNTYNTNDSLKRILNLPYVHYESLIKVDNLYDFGLATLSRYPIIRQIKLFKSKRSTNNVMVTDVIVHGDTIRIFNCHLESFHLEKSNFTTIGKIQSHEYSENDSTELNNLLGKFKKATIKRSGQSDTLSDAIKNSPYPVIVCGDFNEIECSYTYHKIKTHNNLIDAFRESGRGLGGTFIGKLPSFRIDYILHSQKISTWNFVTGKRKLSDHFAIYCKFDIESK